MGARASGVLPEDQHVIYRVLELCKHSFVVIVDKLINQEMYHIKGSKGRAHTLREKSVKTEKSWLVKEIDCHVFCIDTVFRLMFIGEPLAFLLSYTLHWAQTHDDYSFALLK